MGNQEVTTIECDKPLGTWVDKNEYRFIFDWANNHWQRHYRELATVSNVYYYDIRLWKPIIDIARNTEPLNLALLYLNDENKHIALVSKLLIEYGAGSVYFNINPRKKQSKELWS